MEEQKEVLNTTITVKLSKSQKDKLIKYCYKNETDMSTLVRSLLIDVIDK